MQVTVVGALFAWLITGVFTFTWHWFYVRRAMTSIIRRQQQEMAELQKYLFTFSRKWLAPNTVIETITYYEKSDQSVSVALLPELVKYSPRSLDRVIAFHEAVRTVDTLVINFWTDVRNDVDAERPLSEERIKYYLSKIGRIFGYTDRLTSFDGSIRNLPRQFPEVDASEMFRRVEEAYGKWTDADQTIPIEAEDFAPRDGRKD